MIKSLRIKTPPQLEWLENTPDDYEVIGLQGGTNSGKTYNTCLHLILQSIRERGALTTISARDYPRLKRGAIKDIDEILGEYPLLHEFIDKRTLSPPRINFSNGSAIEFVAFDNYEKAHNGKREYLFLNEANHIPYLIAEQAHIRTGRRTYVDFNPTAKFWFYREWKPQSTTITYYSNYKDNYYIDESGKKISLVPEKIIREIQRKRITDPNWYRIYGLGQTGRVEELVYSHEIIEKMPSWSEMERVAFGMDFGYSDPTALVLCGLKEGKLYAEEWLYATQLTTLPIIKKMNERQVPKRAAIFADSHRPDTINTIKTFNGEISGERYSGFPGIKPTEKPRVEDSIPLVQNFMPIHIPATSRNLLSEVEAYKFKRDKYGNLTDKPEDYQDDHALDCLRYYCIMATKGIYTNSKRRRR